MPFSARGTSERIASRLRMLAAIITGLSSGATSGKSRSATAGRLARSRFRPAMISSTAPWRVPGPALPSQSLMTAIEHFSESACDSVEGLAWTAETELTVCIPAQDVHNTPTTNPRPKTTDFTHSWLFMSRSTLFLEMSLHACSVIVLDGTAVGPIQSAAGRVCRLTHSRLIVCNCAFRGRHR